MNRYVFCLAIGFCLAVFAHMGFAQKGSAIVNEAEDRSVFGQTVGNVYTNSVLGIRMPLPNGLEVNEPSYSDFGLIVPAGAKSDLFGKQIPKIKYVFSGKATVPTSFVIKVMKLPATAAGATAEDVMNDPLFRGSGSPAAKIETLGKTSLAYRDYSNQFVQSRTYAYIKNGYYISLVILAKDSGDFEALRQTIARADLNWAGR